MSLRYLWGYLTASPPLGPTGVWRLAQAPATPITTYVTATGSWTVPADMSPQNYVEVIGSGGAGDAPFGGGGGGAYSRKNNVVLLPGQIVTATIGTTGINGADGGDTWLVSAATVMAKGGHGADNITTPSQGGQASAGVGDTKFNGGNGSISGTFDGGGGAGGPNSAGHNGSSSVGGAGGTGGGGAGGVGIGGAGGNGTEWDGSHGSGGGGSPGDAGTQGGDGGNYGAGSGSGAGSGTPKKGIIRITYSPTRTHWIR